MQVVTILLPVIVAFALVSLKLFNSLRTMQIQMGVGVVLSRYESPLLFWFVIALPVLGDRARCSRSYTRCILSFRTMS
jgi:hypothetical protein